MVNYEQPTCEKITTQEALLRVPIQLIPYAIINEITTLCCDEPIITIIKNDNESHGCELMITQSLCIKIPIQYKTYAKIGEVQSECINLINK